MDLRRMLALLTMIAGFPGQGAAGQQPELVVFATASLSQSLGKISELYATTTGQHVTLSLASSSALARQIEGGSKADVVLSADSEWMDYLEKRNLVDPATRRNLLRNRLAMIAPAGSALKLSVAPSFALRAALGKGKLATGEPESVPVGRYTRYALISLGVWNSIGAHVMPKDNVRSILGAVAGGDAVLGVVYESDALLDKRVRIVDVFPVDSHPLIAYPIASTPGAQPGAARFIEFLRGSGSRDVFQRYGFRLAQ